MKCSLWCEREITKGLVLHDFGKRTAPPVCEECYTKGKVLGWW